MQKAKLYKLHRLLSTTVLVLSMIWILSGFMHPIMSWTKPSPAVRFPPKSVLTEEQRVPVSEIILKNKLSNIQKIRLVNIEGKDTYQIIGRQVKYFLAENGEEIEEGDRKYAVSLAHHYSGKKLSVSKVEDIYKFDYKYPFINRLLPVKKVSFEESGEDYYIHTRSSRLGTVGNTLKDSFSWFFKICHNLSFLDFSPWFKLFVMTVSMLAIAFTGFTGLWLFVKTIKQKRKSLRKWHVWAGLFAAQVIFIMTFSGLFHISLKTVSMSFVKRSPAPLLSPEKWNKGFDDLKGQKLAEQSLVTINGKDYCRSVKILAKGIQEVSYSSLTDGQISSDENIAIELASKYSSKSPADVKNTEYLTRFTSEYGFVNKRLPVWKVDFKDSENSYYIETSSQKLASVVTPVKRLEGFSFAYLHKAHFLDFLGKDTRNVILMIFCLFIGFTAVSGVILKKKRK